MLSFRQEEVNHKKSKLQEAIQLNQKLLDILKDFDESLHGDNYDIRNYGPPLPGPLETPPELAEDMTWKLKST
eukprot:12889649-Prorocentrum_lima.AAC.1